MAISKSVNHKKQLLHHSCISVPSGIITSLSSANLQSMIDTPKKTAAVAKISIFSKVKIFKNRRIWYSLFFICGLLFMLQKMYKFVPFSLYPCANTEKKDDMKLIKSGVLISQVKIEQKHVEKSEFWEQPDGLGYRGCLDFSEEYKKSSVEILKDRTKYLVVVVSGGMNQQRNQIVDAVVIARILGANLVVPVLQVNLIWGDESEFSDIFDVEHFKKTLADDVRILSSLPSTHLMSRPVEEKHTPLHVSPQWIRSRYLKRMRREGVLLLRGLDSRLSKDLPSDLQKLRCKVAFHALRFAPPIFELGKKLTERMRSKGPYLALHLRMEQDVWVRTGCLPGLTSKYDQIIYNERKLRPELLTSRSNMTYHDRKVAGLCPLNALEVTRAMAPKDRKPHVSRNPDLIRGVGKYSRSKMYHKRGLWAIKAKNGGAFPTHEKKPAAAAPAEKPPKFYPADDVKKPLVNKRKARPTKLRASITPGTVLIILAGRFKGKRVVFLKQLTSGLLLVTGPFKMNGVPLRRVNQSYVIATSTKVDISGVNVEKFDDKYFGKKVEKKKKKGEGEFFEAEKEEKNTLPQDKKDDQKSVDASLITCIEAVPDLKSYLGARFSLKAGMKPHELVF